jgi:protein-tyrosine phosphatase
MVGFVDVHSHVVPSGDDGAQTCEEGLELCAEAAAHGTIVLYATPHVWPSLPLSREREREVRAAFDYLRRKAPLELRLGFELTPTARLLEEDLRRYALEGTGVVLLDTPFVGPLDLLVALAERAESRGLRPLLAHPERAEVVQVDPGLVEGLAGRGWLLQVNSTSLLGYHGPGPEKIAWNLVERGLADLVASDGHRGARPARLDGAFAAVRARVGEGARSLFDGRALGPDVVSTRPTRSRAASTGA